MSNTAPRTDYRTAQLLHVVAICVAVGLLAVAGVGTVAAQVSVTNGTVFEASDDGPTVEITENLTLDSPFTYSDRHTVDLAPNASFNSTGSTNVTVDSIDGQWTNLTTHNVSAGLTVDPADKQAITIESENVSTAAFRDVDTGNSSADLAYNATDSVNVTISELPVNTAINAVDDGTQVADAVTDNTGNAMFTLPASTDDSGSTEIQTLTILVADTTDPTADAGSNQTVDEDTNISFDGSGSSDNNAIASYEWDFGDGNTATSQTPNHTYVDPGEYEVTLTVTDNAGNTDTDNISVTVKDVTDPTADANNSATSGDEDTPIKFNGSTSTDNETSIVSYEWDWTDDGVYEGSGEEPTHTYADPGEYTVSLRVTDEGGNTDTDSITVSVEDVTDPIANASNSDSSGFEDSALNFDGTASTDNGNIDTYEWEFGDGTTDTGWTPSHSYADPGTYTVELTVTDDAGNTGTDTITVTIEDTTDPTADAGSNKTVDEDTSVSFDGGESSDNDAIASYEWDFGNGDSASGEAPDYTYSDPGTYTVTLTVTDDAGNTDTDTLSVTVVDVTDPTANAGNSDSSGNAGSALSFDGTASTDNRNIDTYEWDWTDDGAYDDTDPTASHTYDNPGTYTVRLRVTDDAGNTDTDTLTVSITDGTAPTISSFGVSNPSAQNVGVAFDSDEKLSTITVAITGAESSTLTTDDFSETDNGDGSYTYEATYSGSTDGEYTATLDTAEDAAGNDGASDESDTVTVDTNDPPTASNDSYETTENETLSVSTPGVLDNDSDPDGDSLIATVVDTPTNGTVGLNTNGSFEYTPDTGFTGEDSFTYEASDGAGGIDQATVALTVTEATTPTTNYTVSITDTNSPVTEGETLSVTVLVENVGEAGSTQPVILEAFDGSEADSQSISLNADETSNITLDWSTGIGDAGNGEISVTSENDTVTRSVTINEADTNDPPTASSDNYATAENETLSISAPGVLTNDDDPNGDSLSTSLETDVSHGDLTLAADGSFEYTPEAGYVGTDSFTYQISDGNGGTDTATVSVSVTETTPQTADFHVRITDVNSSVTAGDSVVVEYTVENTGNATGTQDMTFSVENTQQDAATDLTLGPSESTTGVFTYTTTATDAPHVDIAVATENTTATRNVTVGEANTSGPLTANNDSYVTTENETLVVSAPGVLDNDMRPDGDTITPTVVDAPSNGTLDLSTNGSFTYAPDAGFTGEDSFIYEVSNESGGTDTATVSIAVEKSDNVGETPVGAATIQNLSVTPGEDTLTTNVTYNGSVDGGSVVVDIEDETGTSIVDSLTEISAANNGTPVAVGLSRPVADETLQVIVRENSTTTETLASRELRVGPVTAEALTATLGDSTIANGTDTSLAVTATLTNGTTRTVTREAALSTTDSAIATVDNDGTVTALQEGSTTLRATYNDQTATVDITIGPATLRSIEADLAESPIVAGNETTVTVSALLTNDTTRNVTDEATISSETTTIATVDGRTVTGEAAGTATLTAEYSDQTTTFVLRVSESEPPTITDLRTVEDQTNDAITVNGTIEDGSTAIETVDVGVSAAFTAFVETTEIEADNGSFSTTIPTDELVDDGQYAAYALVTDAADNEVERTNASDTVTVDTTPPVIQSQVTDLGTDPATLSVEADGSYTITDLNITATASGHTQERTPDPSTVPTGQQSGLTEIPFNGTQIGTSDTTFRIEVTAEDDIGNRLSDTITASITGYEIDQNGTTTVDPPSVDSSFVLNTTAPASEGSAVVGQSDSPPANTSVEPDQITGSFIDVTDIGVSDRNLTNATVRIPLSTVESDIRAEFDPSEFKVLRSADGETGYSSATVSNVRNKTINGTEYIVGEVPGFSVFAVGVTDTTAPTIEGTTVSPDQTPMSGESVTVTFDYADSVSGIDVSATRINVPGSSSSRLDTRTTDENASVTVDALLASETLDIELTVVDTAGNQRTTTETIEVQAPDEDEDDNNDDENNGGGGGGGWSSTPTQPSEETTNETNQTTDRPSDTDDQASDDDPVTDVESTNTDTGESESTADEESSTDSIPGFGLPITLAALIGAALLAARRRD